MKKTPMRTCVICREKFDKRDLLRIVRTPEGSLEFDPSGKKNGRGAYICTGDKCVNNVKNIKRIASSLEVQADQETLSQLSAEIKEYLMNKKN